MFYKNIDSEKRNEQHIKDLAKVIQQLEGVVAMIQNKPIPAADERWDVNALENELRKARAKRLEEVFMSFLVGIGIGLLLASTLELRF